MKAFGKKIEDLSIIEFHDFLDLIEKRCKTLWEEVSMIRQTEELYRNKKFLFDTYVGIRDELISYLDSMIIVKKQEVKDIKNDEVIKKDKKMAK